MSDTAFFFLLTVIIGLIAGTAAHLLKMMIKGVSAVMTSGFTPDNVDWLLIVVPVAGIMLTGMFQRYVARRNLEHGVARLSQRLKNGQYAMGPASLVTRMIAASITLGFGGSAGSEGPIACTGASVGSNIGRALCLTDDQTRVLIGCGAAAGIAGIFKSSVGGAMFTFEALAMELTMVSVIGVFTASIIASLTAYVLSGCTIDLAFSNHIAIAGDVYPFVIVLGLFCGFYSIYYSAMVGKMERWFGTISSPWIRNLVSGGILGLLLFSFPALYGEGYGLMGKIINGDYHNILNGSVLAGLDRGSWSLIVVAALVILVKCFACCSSNSGGGVAGDYAPTLFAGVVAGLLFALLSNRLIGTQLPVGLFGLFGMAGVMSGVVRTPMLAVFITTEMAAAYEYFLPICIVGFTSIVVVKLFSSEPFLYRNLRN